MEILILPLLCYKQSCTGQHQNLNHVYNVSGTLKMSIPSHRYFSSDINLLFGLHLICVEYDLLKFLRSVHVRKIDHHNQCVYFTVCPHGLIQYFPFIGCADMGFYCSLCIASYACCFLILACINHIHMYMKYTPLFYFFARKLIRKSKDRVYGKGKHKIIQVN